MKSLNIFLILFTILGLFLGLSGCVNRVDKSGYMFENFDFNSIQKGVTSKNTITKNFGSPTIISPIDNQEFWIYYSENVKHFLFFMPTVIKREIVVLHFDDEDRVSYLKKLNLEDQDNSYFINFNKTFVKSHKSNFLKDIYDNLGVVRP